MNNEKIENICKEIYKIFAREKLSVTEVFLVLNALKFAFNELINKNQFKKGGDDLDNEKRSC